MTSKTACAPDTSSSGGGGGGAAGRPGRGVFSGWRRAVDMRCGDGGDASMAWRGHGPVFAVSAPSTRVCCALGCPAPAVDSRSPPPPDACLVALQPSTLPCPALPLVVLAAVQAWAWACPALRQGSRQPAASCPTHTPARCRKARRLQHPARRRRADAPFPVPDPPPLPTPRSLLLLAPPSPPHPCSRALLVPQSPPPHPPPTRKCASPGKASGSLSDPTLTCKARATQEVVLVVGGPTDRTARYIHIHTSICTYTLLACRQEAAAAAARRRLPGRHPLACSASSARRRGA